MKYINIAPLGNAIFSSTSKWSRKDDALEILRGTQNRTYSFHTDLQDNPWLIIDLSKSYPINMIKITNRLDLTHRAKTLNIEASMDGNVFNLITSKNEDWGKNIDINTDGLTARFIKLSLKEKNFFHLKLIEIFTNINSIVPEKTNKNLMLYNLLNEMILYFNKGFCIKEDILCHNSIVFLNKYSSIKLKYQVYYFVNFYILTIYLCNEKLAQNDFYMYICRLASEYGLAVEYDVNKQCIFLSKLLPISQAIEEDILKIILSFDANVSTYHKVLSQKLMSCGSPKYNRNKRACIIIDSEISNMITKTGFADRLRGILSMIKICNDINVEYYIKFSKPFCLNKYYKFKNFENLNLRALKNSNFCKHASLTYNPSTQLNEHEICLYLEHAIYFYDYIFFGTNMFFFKNFCHILYKENFFPTHFLNFHIEKHINIIGGEYLAFSFRFLNKLCDTKDIDNSKPLEEKEQIRLMEECKNELIRFSKYYKINDKIVVFSDSAMFLHYIKNIPNVVVFPENIGHIANINSSENYEEIFLKTLIDFNLITNAKKIVLFKTDYLYQTRFPYLAALCADKPFEIHSF